ncbi:glycosyltransferase family 4 protein [Puia sp.]|jgi:glycosyltransferase involved in cell wall biosynthesis|uniref:glycosyltransferase family 4 protein n=1 Tax=Puia sp. TaxID=2045100 RepID=UPI002F3EC986
MLQGKHILIIVENLPVPFDRRVWEEANTLAENGAKVSVICPKMKGYTKPFESINGIDIYRHPLPMEGNGALGYLQEYSGALFWELVLAWKIFFKRRFHVIHGCNPPDLIFLVALAFKPFGVKFIFDHHDINPELYLAKFGRKDLFYRLMIGLERLTFATANYSIATNESYRDIAINRGKMKPEKITVVRSGPKLSRLKPTTGNIKYKKGRDYMVGYVGVIGAQEGLDLLLDSIKLIVDRRRDVQFAIVGSGTELEKIKQLTGAMGLQDYIDYYGRVDDATMVDILSTADVCVNPDRPTEMNNLSTMNKIMEYMALKKPIVQYDLKEGRFSAEQASLYASNTSTEDFADKIIWLLDHPEDRIRKGEYGYYKVVNELSWDYESRKLVGLFNKVFARS